jgi:hypothetical protein
MVAFIAVCLLAPGAVAAKGQPPRFPTQGTDALAKNSWIVTLKKSADVALAAASPAIVAGLPATAPPAANHASAGRDTAPDDRRAPAGGRHEGRRSGNQVVSARRFSPGPWRG